MDYKLIVDNRERKVFSDLQICTQLGIDYSIENITTGDYIVLDGDKIIIAIERKTWKDLAASIKDGRIENHNKLCQLRAKTCCQIVLLIEGQAFPNTSNKIGNISAKALIAHLDHMAIRDHFTIIQTKNKEHSISRICSLMQSYKTIKWDKHCLMPISPNAVNTPICRILSNIAYYFSMFTSSVNELKILVNISTKGGCKGNKLLLHERHTKDDQMIEMKMMSCIPRISFSMATQIYEQYSIADLILGNFEKSAIAVMRRPGGQLFGEKADQSVRHITSICGELLDENSKYPKNKAINRDVRVQILSQVFGISETTAITILSSYTLIDIINGTDLSTLLIGSRKLGKKKADNISRIFTRITSV